MEKDFLKINQEDSECLKQIKKLTQDAIDQGDAEYIAYIRLRAASALVGSLAAELKFPKDDEKAALLEEFIHGSIQSYRDTVLFVNVRDLNESVYKGDSSEMVKGLLNFGKTLLRSKILSQEDILRDLSYRMQKTFPSLVATETEKTNK